MDATTKRICALLKAEHPELRIAAASVLGALEPTEGPVLAALSEMLAGDVGPTRLYALQALAASPAAEAVAHMLPAFAAPDELRRAAVDAVVAHGAEAVAHLRPAILGDDLPIRRGAASALARIGGKTANELLIRALGGGNVDLSRHICFELDRAIETMADRRRAALLGQVEKFLSQKRVQKKAPAAVSGLILLGFLKAPKASKTLLRFTRPSWPGDVRRRALQALQGIAEALTDAELTALMGYLDDEDMANAVLPTIELLRPLALPASAAKAIVRLASSAHAPLREFAVFKMGRLATADAAKTLLADLDSPEPDLCRLAIASLRRNPAAAPLVARRLTHETDPHRLWTLARILEPHAATLTAAQRRPISKLMLGCLEADDPRADALAHVLRHADPEGLDAALLKRAQTLKSKKRFDEANRLLRTLLRGDAASTEAQYQAAVVGLKVSSKRLGRSDRQADACLRLTDRLLNDDSIGLAKRLKAEKALEPADLFYVGFHFAEQLRERRQFGGDLLRHVVTKSPRSAVADSARNKLRLEAFPLPAAKTAKKADTKKTARKKASRKRS